MYRLLLAYAFLFSTLCFGQCSNTAYGSYTCKQSCTGVSFGDTTTTCAFGSNVTNGSMLYVIGYATAGTLSLSGCSPATFTLRDSQTSGARHATGVVSSTGACTITLTTTTSASLSLVAVEISGSNQSIDQSANSTFSYGSSLTAPSITTTVNGDFILSAFVDVDANASVFTTGSPSTILVQTSDFGTCILGYSQATAGAIAPTATVGAAVTTVGFNLGLQPSGGGGGPATLRRRPVYME